MNEIKNIKVSDTNCFLIKAKKGYLLIDTGPPGKINKFIKLLHKKNIDIQEINYILLTHHHYDHIGLVYDILQRTEARLILHKNMIPFLEKGISKMEKSNKVFVNLINCLIFHFIPPEYPPVKVQEDRDYIIENDNFTLLKDLGIDGIILTTPGHTSDSIIALLSDGSAFVGDAISDFLEYENMSELIESWNKLIKYEAKILYPSHRKPFNIKDSNIITHCPDSHNK